jgi:hypothetical protein
VLVIRCNAKFRHLLLVHRLSDRNLVDVGRVAKISSAS